MECLSSVLIPEFPVTVLRITAACWIFWIWICFLMVAPMWKQWEEAASECSGEDREMATTQLILSTWKIIRSEVTDCPNSDKKSDIGKSLYCNTVVLIRMKSDCMADIQNLYRITRLYNNYLPVMLMKLCSWGFITETSEIQEHCFICLVIMMISVSLVRS